MRSDWVKDSELAEYRRKQGFAGASISGSSSFGVSSDRKRREEGFTSPMQDEETGHVKGRYIKGVDGDKNIRLDREYQSSSPSLSPQQQKEQQREHTMEGKDKEKVGNSRNGNGVHPLHRVSGPSTGARQTSSVQRGSTVGGNGRGGGGGGGGAESSTTTPSGQNPGAKNNRQKGMITPSKTVNENIAGYDPDFEN